MNDSFERPHFGCCNHTSAQNLQTPYTSPHGVVWTVASGACTRRGKSGLHRAWRRLTAGEGDLEDSATENRPPSASSGAVGKGEKVR